jgi:acyl carrier protein
VARAIEEAGAEVSWVQGESLDGEALARAMATAAAGRGPVEGVIWLPELAAGEHAVPLARLDAAGITDTLRNAYRAFQGLERAVAGHEATSCFLFVPRSVLAGEAGTGRYTAAAAVLEALVHRHNQQGPTAWTVVGWEPGAADSIAAVFEQARRLQGVPLALVPSSPAPERAAQARAPDAVGNRTGARHERPPLSVPFAPPSTEAEETIARIWRELLGIDSIGIHDDFFELGGHSLLGTQLASRLRSAFQIDLPLRALLEAPTIAQQALVAEAALLDELEKPPTGGGGVT